MSWRRKQKELESKRDSVKDRMFSLSDISQKACKKKQTLSRLVGTTDYVIRAKFVTSLSRHLFGLFRYFKQEKKLFF